MNKLRRAGCYVGQRDKSRECEPCEQLDVEEREVSELREVLGDLAAIGDRGEQQGQGDTETIR